MANSKPYFSDTITGQTLQKNSDSGLETDKNNFKVTKMRLQKMILRKKNEDQKGQKLFTLQKKSTKTKNFHRQTIFFHKKFINYFIIYYILLILFATSLGLNWG